MSDFLPAAMALQRQQGWLPSKVRASAWQTEPCLKLSASMAVQATVCSNAQCAPIVTTSAAIIAALAIRRNMATQIMELECRECQGVGA